VSCVYNEALSTHQPRYALLVQQGTGMMGQQRMVNGMVPSQMNVGMQPHMNGPVKMEQQQYQHMHTMQQHQQAHRVSIAVL
jgi:hypothetical protein